ncbi:MAG: hypothetical protein AAGL96_01800 [Pseudomonadota bacterium]
MLSKRSESISVEIVSEVAKEAAIQLLNERAGDWNAERVDIGMFPDGGIVGGRIFCKTLDGVQATDLVKTAGAINKSLSQSLRGVELHVELVDNIITMGGKIGPDILFDQIRG